MQAAARQCGFHLKVYDRLLADLDDRHLALEPAPGLKTAGWLLGHMIVTGDFARRLCGLPPVAPKEWRALFSPGAAPSLDANTYPPMKELLGAIRSIYGGLAADGPKGVCRVAVGPQSTRKRARRIPNLRGLRGVSADRTHELSPRTTVWVARGRSRLAAMTLL